MVEMAAFKKGKQHSSVGYTPTYAKQKSKVQNTIPTVIFAHKNDQDPGFWNCDCLLR
jgi:hypothetical protein